MGVWVCGCRGVGGRVGEGARSLVHNIVLLPLLVLQVWELERLECTPRTGRPVSNLDPAAQAESDAERLECAPRNDRPVSHLYLAAQVKVAAEGDKVAA